ncbi:MAG TPA: hypothetical protein VFP55_03795 [Solirubrobacteraceae bacterium]|nr:hypothetical protein [Solirubrobacteraceae bacterium]
MAPDPDHRAAAGGAGGGDLMERAVDAGIRLGRAWKALSRERRLAAIAAAILWLTLFLPWYQASVVSRNPRTRNAIPVSESLNGWAAFGLVEALILIVSVGILVLLFLRAEGRGELPGGDGWTITGAGALSLLLIIIGLFNAPSPTVHSGYVVSTGLEWGIFLALLAAGGLAWAGGRIRNSLEDDPFLAGNRRATVPNPEPQPWAEADAPSPAPDPAEDATWIADGAEEPTRVGDGAEEPTRVGDGAEEPTRVGDGADEPAPIAEPLMAAAARPASPRSAPSRPASARQTPAPAAPAAPAHSTPSHPTPVPADPSPTQAAERDRRHPPAGPRSRWRPAERPDWSDPERPLGWLTARPKPPPPDESRDS